MNIYRENETPEQRRKRVEADMKAREEARKRNSGIRCYSGQGFVTVETRTDGTKVERYRYGRDGD